MSPGVWATWLIDCTCSRSFFPWSSSHCGRVVPKGRGCSSQPGLWGLVGNPVVVSPLFCCVGSVNPSGSLTLPRVHSDLKDTRVPWLKAPQAGLPWRGRSRCRGQTCYHRELMSLSPFSSTVQRSPSALTRGWGPKDEVLVLGAVDAVAWAVLGPPLPPPFYSEARASWQQRDGWPAPTGGGPRPQVALGLPVNSKKLCLRKKKTT